MENKEERKTETRQGRNPGISKSRRKTFQLIAANSLEGSIIYIEITIQQTGTISQRHRGMNSFELSDFKNAVINVVLHCKARIHGGGKEQDANIVCYDKDGKFFGDWVYKE